MKKISIIVMGLLVLNLGAAFADDAKVLPGGVLRITTAPAYVFTTGGYDLDGKYTAAEAGEGKVSLFNLGFALEYGVNDFVTAALQWAPGVTLASSLDMENPFIINAPSETSESEFNVNGLMDLFLGAKIQIVGSKAPVMSELFRFAVAPGVKIPLPGVDFDAQAENISSGDPVTLTESDKHAFGFGARVYGDYVVNSNFFLNLFAEFISYTEKEGAVLGLPFAPDMSALPEVTYTAVDGVKVGYGYDLKLEVEASYSTALGEGLNLSVGLPLTYTASPNLKVEGEEVEDTASSTVKMGPSLSAFFMSSPVPFELKLAYSFPLAGVNSTASQAISLQIKNFIKF